MVITYMCVRFDILLNDLTPTYTACDKRHKLQGYTGLDSGLLLVTHQTICFINGDLSWIWL